MAEHVRAQIRKAAYAALKDAALVKGRVFVTRRLPLQAEHLPAILIYGLNEDSVSETIGSPRFLSRELELLIEGVAQDNDALDAVLDGLAVAIEKGIGEALDSSTSDLRQLVRAGVLTRTQVALRPPQNADESGTGHIVLTYRVNYRSRADNPTTIT